MTRPTQILSLITILVAHCLTAGQLEAQVVARDAVQQHRNRAARLYVKGLTQARDGNHQSAIDLFTEASRAAPDQAAILLSLSESHQALEQNDFGLFYAEQAAKLSGAAPYLHHLAKSYLRSGQPENALEKYEELLGLEDVDTDIVFEAARLMVHLDRDADAAAAFERLIRMVGDDRILRTQLLQLYGRLEDGDGVERTLQALIRLQPSAEHYYLMLSDFYQKHDRIGDAVRVLEDGLSVAEEAYDISSELILLYRRADQRERADSLAASLVDVGDLSGDQLTRRAEKAYLRAASDPETTETALALLERAVESAPDNVGLLIMLGDLHFSRGSFTDAAAILTRALEKDVRNSDLWVQTALAFLNSDATEDAAKTVDEAIVLFPGRVELFVVGGHANTQLYRNTRAIELFRQALDLLSDDELWNKQLATEAHGALGFLYSRRKNYELSDDHYRRAVRIDSTNAFALNNFAYSLVERDTNLGEAQEMARRALRLEPDNTSFLDTAGWISFKMGNLDEAFELISRAARSSSASATVHRHLGDVQNARGNSVDARASWQRALELDPTDLETKTRLGQSSP